jgi:hypothetical protein
MPSVLLPPFARALLASLVLAAPFALVAHAASGLVPSLTSRAVTALVRATAVLRPVAASEEPAADEAVEPSAPGVPSFEAVTKPLGHRAPKALLKAQPAALFVSKGTVLELARSAARPRGSFVAQTLQHPAGLRLFGVAALGIGLQDGDILIEALGITPRSPGEIIGAIIEARAKQARLLSGTLWRQGQTFHITVEQPYISPVRTSAAPSPADPSDRAAGFAPADSTETASGTSGKRLLEW